VPIPIYRIRQILTVGLHLRERPTPFVRFGVKPPAPGGGSLVVATDSRSGNERRRRWEATHSGGPRACGLIMLAEKGDSDLAKEKKKKNTSERE